MNTRQYVNSTLFGRQLTLASPVFVVVLALTALADSAVFANDAVPAVEDASTTASLAQSVADAEQRFASLGTKDSPEAIDAKQAVIACRRELVMHLAKRNKAEDVDLIRREIRSLYGATAWVANLREQRREYREGQAEWAVFIDCCKQALGIDCPEYRSAVQNGDVLGRMANAAPSKIAAYLENRSQLKRAFGQKEMEAAFELALKDCGHCREIFGDVEPATIKSFGNLKKVSLSPEQKARYFELLEDAIAQGEEIYPASHPTLARAIFSLGSSYESEQRLEQAESTYRRTEPSLQQWSRLIRLATKHRKVGQSEHALRLLDEAFTQCGKTLGENHPLRGFAGTESGDLLQTLGRYEKALARLNQCKQIWKSNSNRFDLANCLNSLALVQQLSGDLVAAEACYQEAVELLADDERGRGLELRKFTKANYAVLLEETGRYPEALKVYEKLIREIEYGAKLSPADLNAREKLALLYQTVEEFAKAETLLDALLQYRDRQPREISQLHSMRGRFYIDVGALDKADEELDAALSYLGAATDERSLDVATVKNLKAIVLIRRGQPAAALAMYEDVLQSLRESLGPRHARCAEIYDQIAKVQRQLGSYSDAKEAHLKSIQINEATYGAAHMWVAWAHHRLGTTHFVFNSLDAARESWRRSFEVKQEICQQTLRWLPEAQATAFLNSLTSNDSSAGRDTLLSTLSLDKAGNAEEAFQCVWSSRGLVLNAIADRQRQLANAKRSPEQAQLSKIRRRLAQLSIHTGSEDSVHRAARNRMLGELNEQKESLERVIAERAQVELARSGSRGQVADVAPRVLMDRLPAQAALVQLVRTERWRPTPPDATEVAKKMVYDAFVVTRKTDVEDRPGNRLDVHWLELGDAAQIEEHIATWRKAILRGDGGTRGRRLGKRRAKPEVNSAEASRDALHQQVWKPISTALGNRTQVVIVPDGEFHRMPWVALPGSESAYLIEEVRITTAADGRQLAQLLQQHAPIEAVDSGGKDSGVHAERFLLIGGVEYDAELPTPEGGHQRQARETSWPYLKGTREEIAAIGEVIPKAQTRAILGEEALEEVVKSEFQQAAVIHIATHGYFADEIDEVLTSDVARGDSLEPRQTSTTLSGRNPLLQCGLTLAGCNSDVWLDVDGLPLDGAQDGYLSAEEIMGMELGRARLVVLSACETGLGSIGSGEGVFGLQRALHISGVKSTIASGWKVDDRATQLLMTEMYHKMFDEGLSPADSLHAAQIRVLRQFNRATGQLEEGLTQTAAPYYWAAFSLSGALETESDR